MRAARPMARVSSWNASSKERRDFIEKGRDGAEALWMTRRKNEQEMRIGGRRRGHASNSTDFFALERAACNDDPQAGDHRLQLSASLQIPARRARRT